MKILFSHYGIYKKGGWGRTFLLAKGLVRFGNDVYLITTNPNFSIFIKKIEIDSVKIIIFPDILPSKFTSKGFGFISLILKVIYALTHRFDIVHSDEGHRPLSGMPCRLNKRIYKSVYIAEWWDFFGKRGEYDTKSFLFKFFLGRYELKWEIKDKKIADGIVVLSEILMHEAKKLTGIDEIIKIHGGADIERIKYFNDNRRIKEKYGITEQTLTFGIVEGLLSDFNDIKFFIDGILELSKQTDIKLLVYGFKIPEYIKKNLKIENILVEFGWIDYSFDSEKLACTDVFVMIKPDNLRYKAGWPNSLGDFMACGRPVLINLVGETVSFVKEHPNGFFITELENDAMKRSLSQIYNSKNDLLSLGKINRQIAEDEIAWGKKSEILNSFYQRIINKRTAVSNKQFFKKIMRLICTMNF